VAKDPVFRKLHRSLHGLVLVGRFVGDKTADRDAAGRGFTRDGHVAVSEMDLGIDRAADGEDDIPGAGLIERVLERSRTRGRGGADDDDSPAPATRGGGTEALRAGEGRDLSPGRQRNHAEEKGNPGRGAEGEFHAGAGGGCYVGTLG
jgi:hypothetical protein